MYNYYEAMKEDIRDYLNDDWVWEEIENADIMDTEDLAEWLNDELWINDSVTGNASGSYTFNRYIASEYVGDNLDLCKEALTEFCVDAETIADRFLSEDWEYFDVTIRCYILAECIAEIVEEYGFKF